MGPLKRGRKGTQPAEAVPTSQPEERFKQLFREYSRPILGYALRRTERPEDAADAVAEVMLIAWRRLDAVPQGNEARLWLFGVARRVVANQGRSAASRIRLGERLRQEASRLAAVDQSQIDEEQETVRTALRRLPEKDREVLLLVAWEGLAPSEVAKVLAISAAAARTRLHRARRRLRRELAALDVNDHPGPRTRSQHVTDPRLFPRTEEES